MENEWKRRIGAEVPPLEELARRPGIKLRHLMIAALLEAGRPLPLDEIAARLSAAGVRAATGDLPMSLLKAWHGTRPVWRDRDGNFGLDPDDGGWAYLLMELGLERGPRVPLPPFPADPAMPDDTVPLTADEVELAFSGRYLGSVSPMRQAGAILDAAGGPMPFAALESVLARLTPHRCRLEPGQFRRRPPGIVTIDDRQVLSISPGDPRLPALRKEIRALAFPALRSRIRTEYYRELDRLLEPQRIAERRQREVDSLVLRRAIVRALPEDGAPAMWGRLDVATREIATFTAAEAEAFVRDVAGYDRLVGLGVRDLLSQLPGVPSSAVLRDLSPAQKTKRLNRAGRTLRITPALIITSSVGISRPLADPKKVADYVRAGDLERLRRRLASDLKSLYALYRYGVLHHFVRLRWGFLDETLPATWAEEGDADLFDLMKAALEGGRVLEVVAGSAPSFADPWSRTRRAAVLEFDQYLPELEDFDTGEPIPRALVQAARLH